jgi:head-tail adaptor
MTNYAKAPKFRAAAKKAGISINAQSEFSKDKLSIRATYTEDLKSAWRQEGTGFEFYSLTMDAAMRLHIAGFELNKVEVPDVGGTKRIAYIYRLAI